MRPFGRGYVEAIGGDYVSINLGALGDASDAELAEAFAPLAERLEADDVFGACVAEASSPVLGRIARLGVRVGGVPWMPFWFRWGYGWPWPARYDGAKP